MHQVGASASIVPDEPVITESTASRLVSVLGVGGVADLPHQLLEHVLERD